MDYMINPIKMGGLVKAVYEDRVKVFLYGRLGVITVPHRLIRVNEPLEPGHEVEFYFSYIQIVEKPLDYDCSEMRTDCELAPSLVGGIITEVNDTAIMVKTMDEMGTVSVPRRWAFTPITLEEGQNVEFYFSYMNVIGKRDIPAEMI